MNRLGPGRAPLSIVTVLALGYATALVAGEEGSKTMGTSLEDTMIATGEFEVRLVPQVDTDFEAGRSTLDKTYHGELTGSGRGQMLSVRTDVEGSAGYVAIEHVTATLAGRSGTFALQHSGTLNRGASTLTVSVVPDSGTGELSGISGEMAINISEGKHYYQLTYSFDRQDAP